MLVASTEPNSWIVAVATAASMLVGAILKTFVDLVRTRDDGQAKWRADMMAEMGKLRQWNQEQQEQLDRYQARIAQLEAKVQNEQVLRHEVKNQLHKKEMELELLKAEHAHTLEKCEQHRNELETLRAEYATLKAEHARICLLAKIDPADLPPTE